MPVQDASCELLSVSADKSALDLNRAVESERRSERNARLKKGRKKMTD